MRPVTLTMKAFGSFANKAEVQFTHFQSGLYLIVGDTGAGKTTIFDAIVFALFGAASGSNRKPDMMHSDYVDKSEDTVVELVFEQNGKQYKVLRTIHFRKKRGTENEYGDGMQDAELTQPEGQPVKGHIPVTRRCEELLGLKADQFRKIVMLAQGEFREFLAADAEKKSDILGRLFDSSEYIRYQNLLSMSRKALESRRKQYLDTIDNVMNSTFIPPEFDQEDETLYLPTSPQLVDHLDTLIASEKQKVQDLTVEKENAQKKADALNTQLGAAESNNQKLDELSAMRAKGQMLSDGRAEMEQLTRQYEMAEKAWHRVQPAKDKWQTAKEECQKTRQNIEKQRESILGLTEARDRAQTVVNEDADKKQNLDLKNQEILKIMESEPQYTELDEKRQELKDQNLKADKLKENLEGKTKQQKDFSEMLIIIQNELNTLAHAEADKVQAEERNKKAQANAEAFNGSRGIHQEVKSLCRGEVELRSKEKALNDLTQNAGQAGNAYHSAYQRFINGQAGILARDLERELEEKGSAMCPVCRSMFHADQNHVFAQFVEGTPSKEDVDVAKIYFEQCEKDRSEGQKEYETAKTKWLSDKEHLLARAMELLSDCESWEQLSADEYLKSTSARFDEEKQIAGKKLQEAQQKMERKEELEKKITELSEQLDELNQIVEQIKENQNAVGKQISGLTAEISARKATLPYESLEDATGKRKLLEKESDVIRKSIEAHQQSLDEAKEALTKMQGELSTNESALPERENAERNAEQAFCSVLSENGFSDSAAFEDALIPMGSEDCEHWLTFQHKKINDYQNDCKNTEQRILDLEEQTRDLAYTDIEQLKKQIDEAKTERDTTDQVLSTSSTLLQNHESVRQKVYEALRNLDRTSTAWDRLDRLADLAVGSNAEGGKLSFERYVMGSIFREVLGMANRRLDVMSGGRYTLVHTMNAGRSNAVAGLEIEVMDVATGKQRPANSLSGGESFQVSLSLALGLSDVVQSHAGGIGLDTLFIDEGFGALDSGALDNAITVLNQLTEGNRLVGIISHVDKLEESIPQKLRVTKTTNGSKLEYAV